MGLLGLPLMVPIGAKTVQSNGPGRKLYTICDINTNVQDVMGTAQIPGERNWASILELVGFSREPIHRWLHVYNILTF